MTKKKIKDLVLASYKNDSLDAEKVDSIADNLPKYDLKRYIRYLKIEENKRSIIVTLPFTQGERKILGELFPNRTIIYKKDPFLMAGVKIIDNDTLYEFDLKDTLDNIVSHIKQSYD